MANPFTPATRRMGIVSGTAVALLSLLYAAVLAAGLLTLPSPEQPIGDPLFSILEALIVVIGPFLIVLMASIHASAPADARPLTLVALVFAALLAGITGSLHFTILLIGGAPMPAGWEAALSFRWPSVAYALDILAWDVFFPLAMLFAAPAFSGSRFARAIRALMAASALLAFAGLLGPVTGDMRLRNIGILGYAVIFPVAAGLLVLFFHRAVAAPKQ